MLKSKMDIVFWSIAAIDAILIAITVMLELSGSHVQNDNGAMLLIVIISILTVLVAILMYLFCKEMVLRFLAVLIVAGVGLTLSAQSGGWYRAYQSEQNMQGRGYFAGKAMNAMAVAVVQRDVSTLLKIGPTVEINALGDGRFGNVTLLYLAVEQAKDAARSATGASNAATIAYLPVVQALLQLGAQPGPGLHDAISLKDSAILVALLNAGADPNQTYGDRRVAFEAIENYAPVENFQLLVANGLKVNLIENGNSLALRAASYHRWDILAILIEHGADFKQPLDHNGRNVAYNVANAIEEARKNGGEPDPALLRVQALINR